jgi:hypothetical protein
MVVRTELAGVGNVLGGARHWAEAATEEVTEGLGSLYRREHEWGAAVADRPRGGARTSRARSAPASRRRTTDINVFGLACPSPISAKTLYKICFLYPKLVMLYGGHRVLLTGHEDMVHSSVIYPANRF